MSLRDLRRELDARGWDCRVMNLNENRKVKSPEYIDVQSGWDYFVKVLRGVRDGCAVHIRCNAESRKGYLLALSALLLARLWARPAFLTYGGGHQQTFFPAPRTSYWFWAYWLLFRIPHLIYCDSEPVKESILRTGIPTERVEPVPLFSVSYVTFTPAPLPPRVEEFYRRHDGIFFSYVCFRKEFELDFLAEVIRRFRKEFPRIGFMWVGPWDREMQDTHQFLRENQLEDAVCVMGSVPHELFLNLLSRSIGYIRTPITDGVCASVLESLTLKIPLLACDNGTRPPGTALYRQGDLEGLLALMRRTVQDHAGMVAAIPDVTIDDNPKRIADSIERICLNWNGR